MHIKFSVAIAMMIAVMPGPPQRSLLHTTHPAECQHQLERPTGAIRTMGEIAVIPGGDEPQTAEDHHKEQQERLHGDAADEGAHEGNDMEGQERDRGHPVDLLIGGSGEGLPVEQSGVACGGWIGIRRQ